MRHLRSVPIFARRSTATAVAVTALVTFAQPLALLAKPATRLAPVAPARAAAAPRRDVPAAAPSDKGAPNFDIRYSKPLEGAESTKSSPDDADRFAAVQRDVAAASADLAARVPGVRVETHDALGIAQIIDVPTSAHVLAKGEGLDHVTTVRTFLADNAGLYGLTREQVAKLDVVSDYTNPAGNLSFVELRQTIGGIPVFRGTIRAALTANGDLARTVAEVVPGVDYAATKAAAPSVSAAEAVVAAAASIGVTVDPASLVVKSTSNDGRKVTFERGPFEQDIQVEQQYFPLKPGDARLAWSMTLWRDVPAYYAFVDASSKTLLFRKNITSEQSQTATYGVYNNDSPAPLSPSTALPGSNTQAPGISRTQISVVSELPAFDNLGWITDGGNTTTGNNVDAGLDVASPDGIDTGGRPTGSPNRVFDFAYNPAPLGSDAPTTTAYRNGAVTNLFFWGNRYHDRLYTYGFTEAAGNFQTNNFSRGGLGNDAVSAQTQDFSGTNNANFSTPADGSTPRCQMYVFTGPTPDRDGDLDADIFIHEFTHGTSNRIHGNGGGLNFSQGGGMGEGWSDFYARCLLATSDEDINGNYPAGGYATNLLSTGFTDNYYYGIRRFPYALIASHGANNKPFNPLTFADVDPSKILTTDGAFPESPLGFSGNGASEVHNVGEIWCSALLEVRARIIAQLGFATGNDRMLQITTDGMKLDPADPTMLNSRDSILAADRNGFAGASEVQIWSGFAARGMGFGATVSAANTSSISVTESFATPNIGIGAVTFSDASCNNNGAADPGETITLTVPLTNQYAVASATGVSATLVGGATQSYGTLTGGQTASKTFTYTVPANTPCGSTIALTFNITSSLGSVTRTYLLQTGTIGAPLPAVVYSSNGISVPVPASGSVGDMADQVINVADLGAIVDVNVRVRLNHTYDGDLKLTLVAPNGTAVTLSANRGSSGDNYGSGANDCTGTFTVFDDAAATAIASGTAPFAGSFKPDSPLSALNNTPAAGAWTLKINDNASGDMGTLYCWQLQITRAQYSCAPATCGGGGNQPPVANAGPDAAVNACSAVTLNGGASSDPDSGPSPLTYAWMQTAGPTVALTGAATSAPSFEAPNVATSSALTFQLAVSDGSASNSDTVTITVNHVAGVNVDTVGLVTGGNFFLRNCNAAGPADVISTFGTASYLPIRGDWDGNGTDTEGAYDPATGNFFLRNSNTPGPADVTFTFGGGGAIPLAGDWDGNGTTTVGLYVPATGTFFLKNTNTGGGADLTFTYGPANVTPLAGDWDGNGTTTVGIYVPATGAFFLRNSNTSGGADTVFVYGPGGAGVTPIVGNWDGTGGESVGLYVSATGAFFLKNTNAGGGADTVFVFGAAGSFTPLGGNWDGF